MRLYARLYGVNVSVWIKLEKNSSKSDKVRQRTAVYTCGVDSRALTIFHCNHSKTTSIIAGWPELYFRVKYMHLTHSKNNK